MQKQIEGFRLSPQQLRCWLLEQESRAYRAWCAIELEGNLQPEVLKEALRRVVGRHQILRTTFQRVSGVKTPLQVIADSASPSFSTIDWSEKTPPQQEAALENLFSEAVPPRSDSQQGSLLSSLLIELSAHRHLLVLDLPATCADARTLKNLFAEVGQLYAATLQNQNPADGVTQYLQFSEWQNDLLEDEETRVDQERWRQEAAYAHHPLKLPLEKISAGTTEFAPTLESVTIATDLTEKLEAAARHYECEESVFLLACWQTLLWRLTGQPDVVISRLFDGRKYEELCDVLGPIAKWLPVSCHFEQDLRFNEALELANRAISGAAEVQEYLTWDASEKPAEAGPDLPPGFEYEEWPAKYFVGDVSLSFVRQYVCSEKFKIRLSCIRSGHCLRTEFHYDPQQFHADSIKRLARQFRTLLRSAVTNTGAPVSTLKILDDAERQELLVQFNDTEVARARDSECFQQLFEQQVARTPNHIALIFEEQRWTYAELNGRVNQLARHLQKLGVGPDVLVAVCLERSLEMVVGLLGILKAGGAYVPLDSSYPQPRLSLMLEETAPPALLTRQRLVGLLPRHSAQPICLDTDWEIIASERSDNPVSACVSDNLAYVIYTSGSTGKPKGVMVTHRGLANYLRWCVEAYRISDAGGSLVHSSISFDLTITGLFAPLLTGQSVRLLPESHGIETLSAAVRAGTDFSLIKITPMHLRMLSERLPIEEARGRTKALVIGGEALWGKDVSFWHTHAPGTRLINEYGPTETVVGCCVYEVAAGAHLAGAVPIGRPIANTEIYLLDSNLEPVPIGVAGEIYVGGDGLARGYLQGADVTADCFIPHPFGRNAGARLYKTGDRGCYLLDGNIEYLGRNDNQVKVRGFRIELGEIETVLVQHSAVRKGVVVALENENQERRLVAYLEIETQPAPSVSELRSFLQERLPEYMVPSAFVLLPALPLTSNGKVDRNALPAPDQARPALAETYVAPRTAVEEVLAAIWAETLGILQVGVHDNFFALGGDSIRSVQVAALAKERGLEFSVEDIFEHQTISDLAQLPGLTEPTSIPDLRAEPFALISEEDHRRLPEGIEDAYPLTMLQTGMIYHLELTPDSPAYHNINSYHIRVPYDLTALQQVVRHVIARHDVLRTSFDLTSYSEPLQLVHQTVSLPVVVEDLRHLAFDEQEAVLSAFVADQRGQQFDLMQPPLMRIHIHRRSEEAFQFTLTEIHAISDGWSTTSLFAEIFNDYVALLDFGALPNDPPLNVRFRDFVLLERTALNSSEHQTYWADQLSDCAPLKLPRWHGNGRRAGETRHRRLQFPISLELFDGLKQLARTAAVPFKSVCLAAHLKVMSILGGRRDILTAVSTNGRPETSGGDRVRGLFLNTVPLRFQLQAGTWMDLVRETFEAERELLPHRRYPWAALQKNWGSQPLSETLFAYLRFHSLEQPLRSTQAEFLTDGNIDWSETNFPLLTVFHLGPFPNSIAYPMLLCFEYDSTELAEKQLSAIHDYYLTVLSAMVANPLGRHDSECVLSAHEQQQLLVDWNQTKTNYPRGLCIHQLFEAQAEQRPDTIAVTFQDQQLTYRELNRRANRLAHYLQALGVGPETLVGLYLERSLDMLIGILGILKAGGAYVPLDPLSPQERLASLLADTQAAVLLTQCRLAESIPAHQSKVICLDSDWELIERERADNLEVRIEPDNLAYVMYTSGSTGRPKGVSVTHRGVVRLVKENSYAQLTEDEVLLQLAPVSFDASTFEIWGALLNGGRLVVMPPQAYSLEELGETLRQHRVTTLWLTAGLFHLMVDQRLEELKEVRQLLAGGDVLSPAHVGRVLREIGSGQLINGYGPTENTTFTCCYPMSRTTPVENSVPIGYPIGNTQVYLLDFDLHPVPIGVAGELYIGGDGLARCYLNSPELTAEKFLPHPFSEVPGARLYRSGDMVRHLPAGTIEFIGRSDQQLKVRGFRVELGEIEAALDQHEAVRECVVMAREDVSGEKRLVAYAVLEDRDPEPTASELHRFLSRKLPDYMMPAAYVLLEALPLTASGKVNRHALPAPDHFGPATERTFVAPRTPTEEKVAAIWAEVLGYESVGVHDNFFELGGHSLTATRLISRIREGLQVELPLRCLFDAPTVSSLAEAIRQRQEERQENGQGSIKQASQDPADNLLTRLDQLSDQSVDALLGSILSEGEVR